MTNPEQQLSYHLLIGKIKTHETRIILKKFLKLKQEIALTLSVEKVLDGKRTVCRMESEKLGFERPWRRFSTGNFHEYPREEATFPEGEGL